MKELAKNKGFSMHFHTKIIFVIVAFSLVVATVAVLAGNDNRSNNPTGRGFDALGYNRDTRIFEGASDGVDGTLDGATYGLTVYANDHLKMKWNAEWDRGNAEGWNNGPYGAWIDNNWNGKVPNGSGEVWQYRIKWIGDCGATGTPTGDGGYCIWGQFEVLMSHGTVANQHFWDAHAIPSGFGI
ncbi:MAG: hypothetical protein ACD_50C00207G0002 [uncultured bacterium]|nr:MAG: hypothetical protein ACD_50C00207G0002 [uncultured bacterium]OGH13112.1 MAG: hypothetical protein A2687_00435 [Candidatus Levybacteria bacterium RIFCSPHIGHO2_01_FULL_38_26]